MDRSFTDSAACCLQQGTLQSHNVAVADSDADVAAGTAVGFSIMMGIVSVLLELEDGVETDKIGILFWLKREKENEIQTMSSID